MHIHHIPTTYLYHITYLSGASLTLKIGHDDPEVLLATPSGCATRFARQCQLKVEQNVFPGRTSFHRSSKLEKVWSRFVVLSVLLRPLSPLSPPLSSPPPPPHSMQHLSPQLSPCIPRCTWTRRHLITM